MKKFLLKIALFLVLMAVCDISSGKLYSYMLDNAKGGDNGRTNHICNETNEELLVFGSSRALHHYNPVILSDSLGYSSFNCGQGGYGIILNYACYQLARHRYQPKILIYDVIPDFDLYEDDNRKYLGLLRPYYDEEDIPEIFESVDKAEKYKMLSQMYRYNTKFLQIMADFIHPLNSAGIKGFCPIHQDLNTLGMHKKDVAEEEVPAFDSLKIAYFRKMISEMNGTKLIFTVSPTWNGMNTSTLQPIIEICQEFDIPLYDFSNDPKYVHQDKYFADDVHLNARGADEFTRDLVHVLKERGVIRQSAEKE